MEAKTFPCSSCGAELEYQPNSRALQCPYCGSSTELLRDDSLLEYEPDFIIPLAVDKDSLRHAVESYMIRGDYTPDDIIEKALITKLEMSYRPAFLYRGDFEAKWTASFGYDRIEHYIDYENKYDSDLKRSIRTPVTKTKTVTDWQPNSGVATGEYRLIGYAGREIRDASIISLVEECSSRPAVDFSEQFLTQMTVEIPAKNADNTFSIQVKGRLEWLIEHSVKGHAQGDRQRDWHWDARWSRSQHSLLIPLCHAQFDYNGIIFNFWTDGTNTSRSTGDNLPVDKGKRAKVRVGFIPLAVLFIATLITALVSSGNIGFSAPNVLALAGALLYGLLRRSAIRSHSLAARSKALNQRRAERTSVANITEDNQRMLTSSFQKQRKPLLARTGKDVLVLPLLTIFLLIPLIVNGLRNPDKLSQTEAVTISGSTVQPQNELGNTSHTQPEIVDDKSAIHTALQSYGYSQDGDIVDIPTAETGSTLHVLKVSCVSTEEACHKLIVFDGTKSIWTEGFEPTVEVSSITAVGPGSFRTQLTQQLPDGSNSISTIQYKWDGVSMSRFPGSLEASSANVSGAVTQVNDTSSASQMSTTDVQGNSRPESTLTVSNQTAPSSESMPVYAGAYVVQIAAVSHVEDAALLMGALRSKGYSATARIAPDKLVYVQIGPFTSRNAADAMRARLFSDGYYNAVVH